MVWCGACSLCGVCGACLTCAACAVVPSPVLALGAVGLDAMAVTFNLISS